MIGNINHPPFIFVSCIIKQFLAFVNQNRYIIFSTEVFQRGGEIPCIVIIKNFHVGRIGAFAQPGHLFHLIHLFTKFSPEIQRHKVGCIKPETVNIKFCQPIFHGIRHSSTHFRISMIQLNHIQPTSGSIRTLSVLFCIIIQVSGYPHIIPGRMIGYPVQPDFHTHSMGGIHQRLKVFRRPIVRINRLIIFYRIGTTQCPCPILLATRMNRHQP